MTSAQRAKLDRLFIAIGRLEGKAQTLKHELRRQPSDLEASDILTVVEGSLNASWRYMHDRGLVR